MPVKRMNHFNFTEDGRLNHALAEWAFDSHNWIEYAVGLYRCGWCQKEHIQNWINQDYPLCKENPALKKFLLTVINRCHGRPTT